MRREQLMCDKIIQIIQSYQKKIRRHLKKAKNKNCTILLIAYSRCPWVNETLLDGGEDSVLIALWGRVVIKRVF